MTTKTFCLLVCLATLANSASKADVAIYFTEAGFGDSLSRQVFSSDITASTYEGLALHPGSDPRSVSVDRTNGKVYYSYGTTIAVTDLDGSNGSTVFSVGTGISELKYNPGDGKIYYAKTSGTLSERGIFSVNTDGTGNTKILDNADLATFPTITVNDVHNIEIDSDNGLIYWTADDGGVAGRIGLNVASLSGTGVSQLWAGTSRSDSISKMAIDFDESMLYYSVDCTTDAVFRSTLGNASIEMLASGLGRPYALTLDLDNDSLFFMVGGTMYQSGLDGSGLLSKLISTSSLYAVTDMDYSIISSSSIPEPASGVLAGFALVIVVSRRKRK
jgi:hypothetical protein